LASKISTLPPHRQLQDVKSTIKLIAVSPDTLNVTLSWHQWIKLLAGNERGDTKDEALKVADEGISLSAPLSLQYRGRETRIVLNGDESVLRAVDTTLLTSIARGYAWRQEMIADPNTSASSIAVREKVTSAYVSRLIELSFLAPDILEDIVSGSQPPSLTFHRLRAMPNVPLDWASQRQVSFSLNPSTSPRSMTDCGWR
jgi:hypothetical protein